MAVLGIERSPSLAVRAPLPVARKGVPPGSPADRSGPVALRLRLPAGLPFSGALLAHRVDRPLTSLLERATGAHLPNPGHHAPGPARLLAVSPGYRAAMNAISLLKNDHKAVENLFQRFEKLGPRAVKTKQDVVERIVRELSIHAAIEEMLFYP